MLNINCPTCGEEIQITNISNDDGGYMHPPDFDFDIKADCDCPALWTVQQEDTFNGNVKTAYDEQRYSGIEDDCDFDLSSDKDYPEFSWKDLETETDEVVNA